MQKGRLFGAAKSRKKSAANLKSDYYIVGLGNPGSKYERTRHNAGFDVVSILAQRHKISVRMHDYKARLGKGKIGDKSVLLVMPQTYMNNSGQSVKAMMQALGVGADKLIVVYDDMDLKLGNVRVKEQGSAGTHNGMKSVIFSLQTDEFVRVRVGIGKSIDDTVDYVLGEHGDKQAAFDAMKKAADAIESIVKEGVKEAQNGFN
ncbi:MAG: aminoacyl-tRNA hydrolase [Clostridia bacterium]|jgi:peptidyl-tRNA hydrolase, PTH1 family|nr:aminoacyl-tRNA hydrolase [Clostridia bacterium]MBT7122649.1 aminoacyl-tRNA hydrolase [Clostridia bacterium]